MGYRWLRKWRPRWVVAVGIAVLSFSPCTTQADVPTEQGVRIQQEALLWTTDYEGLIDGKSGDETIKAIKKFQARLGNPQTGALTSSELERLVKEGYARRTAVGFQQYTDRNAGVSVGIPTKLLPAPKDVSWGKSWYGKEKGIAVDTLRFKSDVSLRDLYNKLLNINNRTITYQRYVEDSWFVISALEKDAAIYVRADLVRVPGQSDEIRGFSIWMDKHRPESYQSIAPAMLSSFRSNTDASHDVSANVPVGGPAVQISNPKADGPKLIPNSPPPKPLTTTGQASSATPCYKGLGDCPPVLTAK